MRKYDKNQKQEVNNKSRKAKIEGKAENIKKSRKYIKKRE